MEGGEHRTATAPPAPPGVKPSPQISYQFSVTICTFGFFGKCVCKVWVFGVFFWSSGVTVFEGLTKGGNLMGTKTKKVILGVAIILAAVAGYVVALLDGDPATKPEIKPVVDGVTEGVGVIRSDDAPVSTAEVAP